MLDIAEWPRQVGKKWQSTFPSTFPSTLHGNILLLNLTLCTVLSVVLRTHPPEWVVKCEGVKEIVEGLVPYTERHFQRLSRLLQVQLVCY